MERHTADCRTYLEKRRPYVLLTPAARRWHFREKTCMVMHRVTGSRGRWRCRGKATLWMVGPRGGITGRWCQRHEGNGIRAYMNQPPQARGELRDAGYSLRSTDEELAMWAIGNGPDVKPWYGPASRASTGG